ncbi:MAG: Crp/Fnr family transcriptional regulator [Bacillota bacterium]|nr:Crp/Fnr family transcriptional regulator [Bacillota bacterium]
MKNYQSILTKSTLFHGVAEREIGDLVQCLSPRQSDFQKGEYLYRHGEKLSSMGLVLQGSVYILKEDYWGNRTILTTVQEGQLFGEAYACSETMESAVSAVAAQDGAALFFDTKRILTLCPSACSFHAQLVRNLITVLADKNIHLTEKIEHLSQRRLRDKVLSYLMDMSKKQGSTEFTIPFSRQELADYLSVDRSALSSELGKLRDEGILEFERKRFRLL